MLNRLSKYKAKLFTFANTKLGCSFTKNTLDRVWLENWIFDNCYGCYVLSVGLNWYDMTLADITLPKFWDTVDAAAEAVQFARFSDRHYTVDLTKPDTLLKNQKAFYDVIILNNVLGRGVNTKAEAKVMIAKLESMLKVGGKLLIGYNASAKGVSYYPELCVSLSLMQIDKTVANTNRRSMYTFTTFTKL